ncbi:MAG: hypothetical protein Q4F01_09250 [Staphylococcus rostri]|uniref:hypothetical protein n=1 Tax=Staphylococcus rostri TaxID=522262 RepID=UPI0026DF91A7|nr:hypothetical protein [Staphylococcus rostri]MDO5376351.1 hypothetical protein [Staphylococcus rostri]
MLKLVTSNWFLLGASLILAMSNVNIFTQQTFGGFLLTFGQLMLKTVIFFIIFKVIMLLVLKVSK